MGCIISDVINRSQVILVEKNPANGIKKNECPVCYDIIDKEDVPNLRFFDCNHILCNDCYKQLIKYKCPLCRAFPKK